MAWRPFIIFLFNSGSSSNAARVSANRVSPFPAGTQLACSRVTALGRAVSYSKKTKTPTDFIPVDYWKGNFTVQIGAFQVKANAKEYRYKLSKHYQNAHIAVFTDSRGTFYRVRIGQFTNLKDAVRYSEKLIAQGISTAFAVAE